MRRLTRLLVVLLAVTIGSTALADCSMAEPMNAEQMACCLAMNHDCGPAGREEGCCPTSERSGDQLFTSAAPQVHPAPLVSFGAAAWTLPLMPQVVTSAAMRAFERALLELSGRPLYLLVSILLI
ncbi:MAG: hypothetical protein ACRD2X_14590 [Vicinamibacteraceae bacterium]